MSASFQNFARNFLERHYFKNRVPTGGDTNTLVEEIAREHGGKILRYTGGQEILNWIVPPGWALKSASIKRTNGEIVCDATCNPLFAKSYSAPFRGRVSIEELRAHILTDPQRPHVFHYDYGAVYQHGKREAWGFTLPYSIVAEMKDAEYDVEIDCEFRNDEEMLVLDWTLPGKQKETIYFSAHTCHPAQVNDGLACIAVLLQLFAELQAMPERQFSYRMVLGPEYFGGAAFLSNAEKIGDLCFGFYLDMLGNGQPLGYSASFQDTPYLDTLMQQAACKAKTEIFRTGYRGVWGNDEMFFDGPDFLIPTLCPGRKMWPHYHTSADNVENCDFAQLEQSLDVLRQFVNLLEHDAVVEKKYRGPLYFSRYRDALRATPLLQQRQKLLEAQILLSTGKTIVETAEALNVSFADIRSFCEDLQTLELCAMRTPDIRKKTIGHS